MVIKKPAGFYLVFFLLLAATILRMTYGYGLVKKIADERKHLEVSRKISVQGGKVFLPLGSAKTHHPVLTSYITAVSSWLVGGSTYGIRVVYILLSVFGLLGLFCLCRELFGYRAAIIALFFGSVDHHLISYAPEFLEPVYLCLVPWTLLILYRAVEQDQENGWILLGGLMGVGYMCSEIYLLMGIPILFFVFSSGKVARIFQSSRLYIAMAVCVLIILPHLLWSCQHEASNIVRHADRVRPLGLTPRLLLLYAGDLLINFKNSSCLVMGLRNTVYGPWSIPCHWITGMVYLVSVGYSLKYRKDRRHFLLLSSFFGIGLVVTVFNAREPWNEIEWGAMTIFPAICLAAWMVDRFWSRQSGRIVSIFIFLAVSIYAVVFLTGPKCGYASPFWEKSFLGEFLYYARIKNDRHQARQFLEKAVKEHPDCALVHYYHGELATGFPEKKAAFDRALALEPHNPLVHKKLARKLMEDGKYLEAIQLLTRLIDYGYDSVPIRVLLSRATYDLGHYSLAKEHIWAAFQMKPDEFDLYEPLFHVLASQGKFTEGLKALEKFAVAIGDPIEIYRLYYQKLAEHGHYRQAAAVYEKARETDPDLPLEPPWPIQHEPQGR